MKKKKRKRKMKTTLAICCALYYHLYDATYQKTMKRIHFKTMKTIHLTIVVLFVYCSTTNKTNKTKKKCQSKSHWFRRVLLFWVAIVFAFVWFFTRRFGLWFRLSCKVVNKQHIDGEEKQVLRRKSIKKTREKNHNPKKQQFDS